MSTSPVTHFHLPESKFHLHLHDNDLRSTAWPELQSAPGASLIITCWSCVMNKNPQQNEIFKVLHRASCESHLKLSTCFKSSKGSKASILSSSGDGITATGWEGLQCPTKLYSTSRKSDLQNGNGAMDNRHEHCQGVRKNYTPQVTSKTG